MFKNALFSLLQLQLMAAVKGAGMLWHLADALHFDEAIGREYLARLRVRVQYSRAKQVEGIVYSRNLACRAGGIIP